MTIVYFPKFTYTFTSLHMHTVTDFMYNWIDQTEKRFGYQNNQKNQIVCYLEIWNKFHWFLKLIHLDNNASEILNECPLHSRDYGEHKDKLLRGIKQMYH